MNCTAGGGPSELTLLVQSMRKLAGRTLLEVLPPKLTGVGGLVRPLNFLSFTRDGILGHQINKRLESLHSAIRSAFYWRILKKTILFSDLKNPYKKSTKQENSSLFMNSIL
jgi:hypothetical protein